VSLSENLDISAPAGRTVLTVLGALAEMVQSLIIERALSLKLRGVKGA
jgi:DNA invertase Pin-like site-specific DNA recombinase